MAKQAMAHADYDRALQEHVSKLIVGAVIAPPKSNTAVSTLMQRYSFARTIKAYADKLCSQLRQEIEELVPMPTDVGKYPLHDDTLVYCEALVRTPAMRLDEAKVLDMFITRFDLSNSEARDLLAQCYTANKPATQITVTLKR